MRFRELNESELSDAQKSAIKEIVAAPGKGLSSPMKVLVRSPELALRAKSISIYLNTMSSLTERILQMVILITAKYWRAETMWSSHSKQALKAGLSSNIVSALALGKHPEEMMENEDSAYRFCTELHNRKAVSDETFEAAIKVFGEKGVADLIAACGYYSLVAMALKAVNNKLPPGEIGIPL